MGSTRKILQHVLEERRAMALRNDISAKEQAELLGLSLATWYQTKRRYKDTGRRSGPPPLKYTEELVRRICAALEGGASRRAAAESNGISFMCLEHWLNPLDKILDEEQYLFLTESLQEAEARAELTHSGSIHRAGVEGDWRASDKWLAKRRPKDWADVPTPIASPTFNLVLIGGNQAQQVIDTTIAPTIAPTKALDNGEE